MALYLARAAIPLVLAGCATTTTLPVDSLRPLSGQAAALVEPGPFDYTLTTGERPGEYGCTLAYETYEPSEATSDAMVFLAHGFLRKLKTMRGWAEHWASHGVAVTVMSLCNSSAFAGHHDRNAEDMVALAKELHDGTVIYAGFSAGGLAALLAAASDARTTGYLGLDSVDNRGLALAAAPGTEYPALILVAEPSSCNARNNFLDAAAALARYRALRVDDSTHCHYEYPYDSRCEMACGSVRPDEAQAILIDTVRSIATAWILEVASADPSKRLDDWQAAAASDAWRGRVEIVRLREAPSGGDRP